AHTAPSLALSLTSLHDALPILLEDEPARPLRLTEITRRAITDSVCVFNAPCLLARSGNARGTADAVDPHPARFASRPPPCRGRYPRAPLRQGNNDTNTHRHPATS